MRTPFVKPVPRFAMTRRQFVAGLAGLAGLGFVPREGLGQSRPRFATAGLAETLRTFVDVIVPADDPPSAGELNVHVAIIDEAAARTNYPALLTQGTAWLNERARSLSAPSFAAASDAERRRVVEEAFAAEENTLPRVFARFLRDDVMRHYYGRPEAWAGMIDAPPQAEGYPDAHLPPETVR